MGFDIFSDSYRCILAVPAYFPPPLYMKWLFVTLLPMEYWCDIDVSNSLLSLYCRDAYECRFDTGAQVMLSALDWILQELDGECDSYLWLNLPLALLATHILITTIFTICYHYRFDAKILWYRAIGTRQPRAQVALIICQSNPLQLYHIVLNNVDRYTECVYRVQRNNKEVSQPNLLIFAQHLPILRGIFHQEELACIYLSTSIYSAQYGVTDRVTFDVPLSMPWTTSYIRHVPDQ